SSLPFYRTHQHLHSFPTRRSSDLSDDYSMVEVRSGKAMLGKTLIDLDIRAKFGCNVVAIRHGKEMNVSPSADYQITEDDVLIVIGADKDISKFERHYVIDN